MNTGTNDYNAKKLTPSEVVVSRTLQARYRSFSNVIWRSGKPALDSEWNLINDMTTEFLSSYIQSKVPSGWIEMGENKFSTNSNISNNIRFYSQSNQQNLETPNAIVNGWPVLIAGTYYTDTSLNSITLSPSAGISRTDFVFLEAWRAQVRSRDTNNNPIVQNKPSTTELWGFGNTQLGIINQGLTCTRVPSSLFVTFPDILNQTISISTDDKLTVQLSSTVTNDYLIDSIQTVSGHTQVTLQSGTSDSWTDRPWTIRSQSFSLVDDIIDSNIKPSVNGIETSQRVQIQYKIRVVSGVTFADNESKGFEDPLVLGQGANSANSIFQFTNMKDELGDPGLWRAGLGDQQSQVALGSVDGFSYAIPMFKINRRSTILYSDTGIDGGSAADNQQGNSSVLGAVSDRPDGKFNDGIDASDIIDMRMKVFPNGINYDEILEKNLDKLFAGELRSNNLQTLHYDSIASHDIFGYNDFLSNQGASGKRIYWSDTSTLQTNVFALVTTATTSTSLDAYRALGTGAWVAGNTIIVQVMSSLPVGTMISSNVPRVYFEDKSASQLTPGTVVPGSWVGLGTTQATFTLAAISPANSYNIWIYYDLQLSAGQGISQVPDDVLKIDYYNYDAFPSTIGNVVKESILFPTNFQDLSNHTFENQDMTNVYTETQVVSQRKQLKISPMIQTTTTRDGAIRALQVATLDHNLKQIFVPYPIQHLRGVYTAATAGTELATKNLGSNFSLTSITVSANEFFIQDDYFVCLLTSLKYDTTALFTGSEIELLSAGGGNYGPVLQHRTLTTETGIGTRVKLYDANGVIYTIPPISTSGPTDSNNFRFTGSLIRVRSGAGYGFDLGGLMIDCSGSDEAGSFPSVDRQPVWVDMDFLGAPHQGAEVRVIYKATPYQGSNVGNQIISIVQKREKGFFFNNGTGGGDTTTTSNLLYTPLSPKLPGSFQDYLRDGATITISSTGTPRYASDLWSTATYDLYGHLGGGELWTSDFTLPALPEITQRGFSVPHPFFETIFEAPVIDHTYAEFALAMLVRNKITGEIYLLIQIGNKGVHDASANVLVDIFHLNERVITK
jgi:hypothetical protein